jgi:hypothetical protein
LTSDRWQRLANFGARPQRLLFASTGTKDPKASDVLYIAALAAPNTIDTIPEKTLWPSLIMANWLELFPAMEETVKLFSPIFKRRELIWNSWRPTCNGRAPSPSMNRGKTCSVLSRPRARSCSTLPKSEAFARPGSGRL